MARFISIFFITVVATISLFPTNGRARRIDSPTVESDETPTQQKKYLLVQLSETIFGDQISRNDFRGKPRQFFAQEVSKGISAGVSALKNKALSAFDKANQGNVAKKIGLGSVFAPSSGSKSKNNGNKGNSGGNMMG